MTDRTGDRVGADEDVTTTAPGDTAHPWLALLDRSPLGVLVHDGTDRVLHANPSFARLVDRPLAEILQMSVEDLIDGTDWAAHAQIMAQVVAGDLDEATTDRRIIDRHGQPVWVRTFESAIWVDDRRLIMLCVTDLRDWQQRVDQLGYAASHDELTGLLNRSGLAAQVAQLPAEREPGRLAVLDINGLKTVNDAYGHAAGDHVLRVTAELLAAAGSPSWLIGRLGGDEFVVVDTEPPARSGRPHLLRILDEALSTTVTVAPDVVYRMSASVGEVTFAAGEDFDEALRIADREMYRHKRSGPGSAAFLAVPTQGRGDAWSARTDEIAVGAERHARPPRPR